MVIKEIGADGSYTTAVIPAGPQYETNALVNAGRMRLYDLYAYNSGAATVYLAVIDAASVASATLSTVRMVLPIPAGAYDSWGIIGGRRFASGVVLKAFLDVTLQTGATSCMFYHAGFRANH